MKRILLVELLLVLITIIFVSLNPISRIYIADYLEKISTFLFRTVGDEDLNEWYEKEKFVQFTLVETDRKGGKYRIVNCYPNKDPKKSVIKTIKTNYKLN